MRTLKKFERKCGNIVSIKLPARSEIIRVSQAVDYGYFYIWIAVPDDEKPNTYYDFYLFGDEDKVPNDNLHYIGTLVGPVTPFYHVFFGIDGE